MTNSNKETPQEAEVAKASDIEQKIGHGGNMRDAGAGADMPPTTASDVIGSSGHIPRLEEINPAALDEHSGSSGADADRKAAGS